MIVDTKVSVICLDTDGKLPRYLLSFAHRLLIQEAFDSHESSADPTSFKPLDRGLAEIPICQAYRRKPLPLSLAGRAKSSAQHGQDTNTPTDRDRLNFSNLSNDFEVH
jgi:hypothetical protein